jgi:protein TonB
VDPSSLIHTVQPVYPRLAVITKISGKVVIEAVITRQGTIDPARMRVLSTDHAFLTQAALDAVKQWRYKPLILNDEPVEILTTITVNFTLN